MLLRFCPEQLSGPDDLCPQVALLLSGIRGILPIYIHLHTRPAPLGAPEHG